MRPDVQFEEIYNAYHERISKYLSKIVGKNEAEDLVQEVFDKVNRSIGSFRGESNVSTWVYRIATNHALDKLKSPEYRNLSKNTISIDEEGDHQNILLKDGTQPRLEIDYIRQEMNECIREYIDRLPTDHKTVIILSELEDFSNREISDILQVSLDTVKIRLHRARARLRKDLEKGCIFYNSEQGTIACDRKPLAIKPRKTL
jgi:RNA polymerase sigma-70 factor (ECF subfamily)